ncbi:unnamed protein product [Phytophthora fragariaefolia]|uniref:Unnamed protein product n=1 Tax=Phytophthora fragariaefolia TaxID=1490495 RepID=A0A9W6YDR2_9STRA|nr:unnamed protein product [Phytophthora fragariaefolia]
MGRSVRRQQEGGVTPQVSATEEVAVTGIDVGTGASCIYALLGAAMNKWKFVATEMDSESCKCAKENVSRNQLEAMILIKQTHSNKLLLEPLQDEPRERKFHFVMCNPPFFDNMNEADTNPEASCMGSANEMVFPGGEVAFIGNMIADSVELQTRVLWFTSMVGKKSSLPTLGSSCTAQSGCVSIQDVLMRIREFVATKTGLKLSADEFEEEKEDNTWLMFRLEQQRSGRKESVKDAIDICCAGRVEIFTLDNSNEGFEVLLAFEEGERAAFWTMADMLQAATVRTGRQWRRKLQRQQQTH